MRLDLVSCQHSQPLPIFFGLLQMTFVSMTFVSNICFFGANLIAFRKPDGGVRPIGIGFTLRRMIAKAVSFLMFDSFGTALRPVQFGVGTKSGCEVAVHATRRFLLSNLCNPQAPFKLDFKNAFNSLHRDRFLAMIHESFQIYIPSYGWHIAIHQPSFLEITLFCLPMGFIKVTLGSSSVLV